MIRLRAAWATAGLIALSVGCQTYPARRLAKTESTACDFPVAGGVAALAAQDCGAHVAARLAQALGRTVDARSAWAACAHAEGASVRCLAQWLAEQGLAVHARSAPLAELLAASQPVMVVRQTAWNRKHYELLWGRCGHHLVLWEPVHGTYLIAPAAFEAKFVESGQVTVSVSTPDP